MHCVFDENRGRRTCCSGIFSLSAVFRSLPVLRPRVALSKHVPKDEPEKALRLLRSDNPLILPGSPESSTAAQQCNAMRDALIARQWLGCVPLVRFQPLGEVGFKLTKIHPGDVACRILAFRMATSASDTVD